MSQNVFLRRFRPYLSLRYQTLHRSFSKRTFASSVSSRTEKDTTNDYRRRVTQLEAYKPSESWYPRLNSNSDARWSIQKYREELDFVEKDETLDDGDTFTIAGTRAMR